jgi:hypothetical protein
MLCLRILRCSSSLRTESLQGTRTLTSQLLVRTVSGEIISTVGGWDGWVDGYVNGFTHTYDYVYMRWSTEKVIE